jgi:hypothetical protein
MGEVVKLTNGEVVAVDGKTLRGSFDRAAGRSAIHMVSAWARGNGVVMLPRETGRKPKLI